MKRKLFHSIPLTILLMLLLCVPASAKTKSILLGMKFTEAKGASDWGYNYSVCLEGTAKAGSKTPTISAKILLPKALIAKKNEFGINFNIGLHDPSIADDDYIGEIPCKEELGISVNKKGKPSISRYTITYDGKAPVKKKAGSVAKIKKAKNFYILTIKNLPMWNAYIPRDKDWIKKNFVNLSKTKTYLFEPRFNINSWGNKLSKKVNGWIYIDKFTVSAARKLTLNMSKWNFRYLNVDRWSGDKNSTPAKQLKYITY